jgi:hypothetical protein
MLISRSCSHCHTMNVASERYCRSCGHEAHVARLDCQCTRCNRLRRAVTGTDTPMPIADLIARTIAALRSHPSATDHLVDLFPDPERKANMTADRNNRDVPDRVPVTRDVKRTPVPANIAEMVRALDDALQTVFGFDLCYVVLARGGIVAASNARDGYLPPLVTTE